MAIEAADNDSSTWTYGGDVSIADYLIANKGMVNTNSASSDVSRYILALTAAKQSNDAIDPTNVGGTNFVSILQGLASDGQIGDPVYLSDDYWGIMALISAGVSANSQIIHDSVAHIKTHQNPADGGWGWDNGTYGGYSDVDDTAAAIMALRVAGEASTQSNIAAGIEYLHNVQD